MEYYIISYTKAPLGESGESCSSNYDLSNACNECGTGAELIGNLKVKGFSKINKEFFETLDGDFIISKDLYNTLKKELRYLKLVQINDSKNKLLDFYHFSEYQVLDKFKENSKGFIIENQCKVCKRNGYFSHTEIGNLEKRIPTIIYPFELKYEILNFKNLKNKLILNTWECFGLSNRKLTENKTIRYARPLTIINAKIKEIFESERVENIKYEPLIIE